MSEYRNYRELTQQEEDKLKELYPTTTNRELSKMFNISIDAIRDHIAIPLRWEKKNYKCGNRGGVSVCEKTLIWIIKHYKHTRNRDILDKFGIGESTLHRIARKHHLTKSKQFMRKVLAENSRLAVEVSRTYGLNAERAEYTRQQWVRWKAEGRKVGFQPGISQRERLGEEKFHAMRENIRHSRNETIRKERMRINWGLPQRTKLKLTSAGHKAATARHRLKKRGYIVERGSTHIYYDDNTRRHIQMEQTAIKNGLRIEQA